MTCQLSYFTVQFQASHTHCPIFGLVITNHVQKFSLLKVMLPGHFESEIELSSY